MDVLLEPGLRAVVEPLPGGHMALHWVLVTADDIEGLGTYVGTREEVMTAFEHLLRDPDRPPPQRDLAD